MKEKNQFNNIKEQASGDERPQKSYGNKSLSRLPPSLQWSVHNIVAHPVSEVLFLSSVFTQRVFGRGKRLDQLQNWLHDITIPYHEIGSGRG